MEAFDVVVLGTGAAGLTAAWSPPRPEHRSDCSRRPTWSAARRPGRAARCGSRTTRTWQSAGVADIREEGVTYLMSLSHGLLDRSSSRRTSTPVPRWCVPRAYTPVQFCAVPGFPDYHPEYPGGSREAAARSSARCSRSTSSANGATASRRRPTSPSRNITMSETPLGQAVPEPPRAERCSAGGDARRAGLRPGAGRPLAARPASTAASSRAPAPRPVELVIEDGGVAGVAFETPDGPRRGAAPDGVILATGGFEWNDELVRAFLRGPCTHPVAIPTNTGDGLRMAMRVGAVLGEHARGVVGAVVDAAGRGSTPTGRAADHRRAHPAALASWSTSAGSASPTRRPTTTPSAAPSTVEDVARFDYANLPCWLVFDQDFLEQLRLRRRHRRRAARLRRGSRGPTARRARPTSSASRPTRSSATVDALERARRRRVTIPTSTAARARTTGWWGDPAYPRAPRGDARAARRRAVLRGGGHSGALGTKGGPQTDATARVLDVDGDVDPRPLRRGQRDGARRSAWPTAAPAARSARHGLRLPRRPARIGRCLFRSTLRCLLQPRRDTHHRRGRTREAGGAAVDACPSRRPACGRSRSRPRRWRGKRGVGDVEGIAGAVRRLAGSLGDGFQVVCVAGSLP